MSSFSQFEILWNSYILQMDTVIIMLILGSINVTTNCLTEHAM